MSYLLTQLVNGVSLGLVLGLIAVGFVVVFKSTGVLNVAHGSVLLLGAYLVARLHPEYNAANVSSPARPERVYEEKR